MRNRFVPGLQHGRLGGRPLGLVIAATHSGCGKTLVTLGLAAALQKGGLRVQGFKVGPDFIDPTHLAAMSGRPVHNLDGWMLTRDVVLEMFHRHAADADFCLVEGVMGLFDGASGRDEGGSTAQMAKWLGLPVVLVANARSQGRSAAALIRGFRDFDPDVNLAGVIFNQVGGPGHEAMLREAMAAYLPDLPCLGFLPRRSDLALPSRHLGLHMADDLGWDAKRRQTLASWIAAGLDMELLHRISRMSSAAVPPPSIAVRTHNQDQDRKRIGESRLAVARDAAFCFYYQENLRLLEQAGAEIVLFSPLMDATLPEDVQGLILGGGYPELHAAGLAANDSMRDAIQEAARAGMPVYAECGGLMYLLAEMEDVAGKIFPMVGLFPGRAKMYSRFQALGYREVELCGECLLGPAGTVLRGHEFHYSGLGDGEPDTASPAFRVTDRRGRQSLAGFHQGSVVASYIHLHFGSNPQTAASFAQACANWAAKGNTRT